MKIWLDSADSDLARKGERIGILYGVTTNPAIIAQSDKPMDQVLQLLLKAQSGPVTAQVVSDDVDEMIKQGNDAYEFSNRIIVKVPISSGGLEAIRHLSACGIPTMATVVFHPYQVLLAATAGADYIAPYVGHIEKKGKNPWEVLTLMNKIIKQHEFRSQLLAASISTLDQIEKCAEIGIPHITLKAALFEEMISTAAATQERLDHFYSIWNSSKNTFLEPESVSKV